MIKLYNPLQQEVNRENRELKARTAASNMADLELVARPFRADYKKHRYGTYVYTYCGKKYTMFKQDEATQMLYDVYCDGKGIDRIEASDRGEQLRLLAEAAERLHEQMQETIKTMQEVLK